MDEARVVVVTSCTNTKVPLGPDGLVPAESLYVGEQHRRLMRGVSAFRGACPNVELDLSIVSAGHGLVGADALVGPYDATFSGVGSARLEEEGERLRIPRDLGLRLSEPYKLGILLLGTDYLRASTISSAWTVGGPTIAFCSAASARRLKGIQDLTCVHAGRDEARRFSCGLVGLKGEMAGRMLELLAQASQMLDTFGRMSTDKILKLIDSPQKTDLQAAA